MQKSENNYAFIDTQNLYLAAQKEGWKLDWERFYLYLKDYYSTSKVFIFIGYIKENEELYSFLRKVGYSLVFKEVTRHGGKIKGNVDVELTVQTLIEIKSYNQAILVTNDGDFAYLIEHLISINKLKVVLSTHPKNNSWLLRKAAHKKMQFIANFRSKVEMKRSRSS